MRKVPKTCPTGSHMPSCTAVNRWADVQVLSVVYRTEAAIVALRVHTQFNTFVSTPGLQNSFMGYICTCICLIYKRMILIITIHDTLLWLVLHLSAEHNNTRLNFCIFLLYRCLDLNDKCFLSW